MADTTITTKQYNGSYAYTHEITSGDVSNGGIVFDFEVDKMLTGVVQWKASTGAIKAPAGMIIESPADGQIRLEDGSVTWVAGDFLTVIANIDRAVE